MKECVYVDKEEIRAIIAEHFHVDLNDVIMHNSTVTVSNISEDTDDDTDRIS